MQKLFFTPGPSQLYPTVREHILAGLDDNIASLSHRSLKFQELFYTTVDSLKKLLDIPKEYEVFFVASSTEGWERILQNCVERESYHFINGAFSRKFYTTAQQLRKNPQKHETEDGKGFYMPAVDVPDSAEMICFVQNETSTGVALDMKDIYYIKKANPDKLIAVDIVSAVPYTEIDYEFTDCVFFSVQKGFGLPAGLGVIVVSPKAMEKAKSLEKRGVSTGSYHSFITLQTFAAKNQTPETPNVLGIYLLNKVIGDMNHKGLNTIRDEIRAKAKMLEDFFINKTSYHLFVKDEALRSPTVTVVEVEGGSQPLIEQLIDRNIVVGSGYGAIKASHIRIANFPAHSVKDMQRLISELESMGV